MPKNDELLSPEKIARRMDDAVRRALSTPPTPAKALVGKTERAQSQRESRETKVRRARPKGK